ncbi:MAG: hypothetical protein PHQ70_01195 [Arcobacter sp.]|uniref:hypothetical protein n=1 Tax=Arcobacter sp. TaxID=1872629 RepID=UPI00258B19F4|nr:hypothetical protein [Arcobacter sp.]MDD3007459.1 hypothetical protein [Arcobacter sp.]
MISISNKTIANTSKLIISILVIYTLVYVGFKAMNYYKSYYEKEKLTNDLQLKRDETNSLKTKANESKKRIEDLEKSYMTKEEIETKVKDIFSRMSLLDYQLDFIDSKKMCIDRYIIITRVNTQSENGLKAAEGILSYLGEIKKSDKDDTLYFVNYISKAKEIR